MENATKGLMIAGAILIAIVIIGIGVFLVAQAQGFMGQGTAKFSEMEVKTFNSPYQNYEGQKRGSEVNSMISDIITNNIQAFKNNNLLVKGIILIHGSESNDLSASTLNDVQDKLNSIRRNINPGKTYTIEITSFKDSGLIEKITIID